MVLAVIGGAINSSSIMISVSSSAVSDDDDLVGDCDDRSKRHMRKAKERISFAKLEGMNTAKNEQDEWHIIEIPRK